jgi:hypothetical protein
VKAHVAEFLLPEAEVAEPECQIPTNGIQLREETGGVAVGGEEFDDGFEVDDAGLLVEGSALGAPGVEECLALGGCDELHGFDSFSGGAQRSVRRTDGPRSVRLESNAAHQCSISTDRGSTGRDSGFALARAVHPETGA